jgi:hypothetical protein
MIIESLRDRPINDPSTEGIGRSGADHRGHPGRPAGTHDDGSPDFW